jgi:alpha,alpha-trehalase
MPRPSMAMTSSQSSAVASTTDPSGFVLRYRTGETDDGMSGKEGTFLICSFWLVSALAMIGEEQRAVT